MSIGRSDRGESAAVPDGLRVAVLMGGVGEERRVSIQSGTCVADALRRAGLDVVTGDVAPDRLDMLDLADIDVFFLALHGRFGEDGTLQRIMAERGLCYTGSGPEASRLAFDKWASKEAFAERAIATPPAVRFDPQADTQELKRRLERLGGIYVVKPLRQGSSIGVSIVRQADEAIEAARRASDEFGDCMIESFVAGREITVGVLQQQVLPIVEISSSADFYDYHAKYIDERTEYLFDTIDDPVLIADANQAALGCFKALGCRHFARADFILADDGIAYVLEVNTIPGFTTHSLLPRAAARAGISMSELCVRIVEAALADRQSATDDEPEKPGYDVREVRCTGTAESSEADIRIRTDAARQ